MSSPRPRKPKALVFRPGHALGDTVFVTPIPRLLAQQGYTVHVACEESVKPVLQHNPYISKFLLIPEMHDKKEQLIWISNFPKLSKGYDKILHAHGYVEVGLMYRSDVSWGFVPNASERKEKAKGKSYQDEILAGLGFEERGLNGEIYFSRQEKKEIAQLRRGLGGRKLVIWQWDGSTQSKVLVFGPQYLEETMRLFPDAVHYVFAKDANLKAQIPHDGIRVVDGFAEHIPVRDSIKMVSMADLVIGPESFLVNAAAAFDTPTVLFFSHSAPENLAKYYKNCYPIVPLPEVTCHPCYLLQINFQHVFDPLKRGMCREFERNCRVWNANFIYESLGVKCCFHLPHDQVMRHIKEVLGG